MERLLTHLRLRRAPLRRWLAVCVRVFGFQTAAPALTWCLHGGDVAVHDEAVVFDLAGHAASMDHCAHHATDHRMFEAGDPGTAASVASVAVPSITLWTCFLRSWIIWMDTWDDSFCFKAESTSIWR